MYTDVTIVGGGLVGLSMACVLTQEGISVSLIETQDPKKQTDDKFDGRCSAIAPASVNIFKAMGIWNDLKKHAGPVKEVFVTDGDSPAFLHIGKEEWSTGTMGYMIENRFIRRALFGKLLKQKNITLFAPAKYKNIDYDENLVRVELEDKKILTCKLLIAADGRFSKIREKAGIKTFHTDYNQSGIVCAIKHEKDHKCTAQERFLPAGPFAILPMVDRHYSSLVWAEKPELASHIVELDKKSFEVEVQKRFGDYLGKIELVGKRWCYPLSLTFAHKYSSTRMCLLGDAAHAIHPVAGTGFNLSLRDVAQLAELIIEMKGLGLDIGGATVRESYERLRKKDNLFMIAATHGLTRLFSNKLVPLKLARNTGLAIFNKVPPIKKFFMHYSMGKGRKFPKLAKGEEI